MEKIEVREPLRKLRKNFPELIQDTRASFLRFQARTSGLLGGNTSSSLVIFLSRQKKKKNLSVTPGLFPPLPLSQRTRSDSYHWQLCSDKTAIAQLCSFT